LDAAAGGRYDLAVSTDGIRELVRRDCEASLFGAAFYDDHVALVARFAVTLAGPLNAEAESVELAAWLHDLAAVRDPAAQPEHPRLGAELAPGLLAPYGYESMVSDRVAAAIASHSFPLRPGSATPEEVCLSQADAVAQIVRPVYWFYFVTTFRGLGYLEAVQWLKNLLETKWEALIEPARRLTGDRYAAAMALLDEA
jgi:uncharacterized protein